MVSIAGSRPAVNPVSVAVKGNAVTLTLASAVAADAGTVRVNYTVPPTEPDPGCCGKRISRCL